MNDRLLPCPSCARHVRVSDDTCPFCATTLPPRAAPALRIPAGRLGRAALFALGTGAASVAACGGSTSTSTYDDAGSSSGSSGSSGEVGVPAYGLPALPVDGGTDAPILVDAAYGGPPHDAAADAEADGSAAPAYGLPPNR